MTSDPNRREYWDALIAEGGPSAAISRAQQLAADRTEGSGAVLIYAEERDSGTAAPAALLQAAAVLAAVAAWPTGTVSSNSNDVTVTADAMQTAPSAAVTVEPVAA